MRFMKLVLLSFIAALLCLTVAPASTLITAAAAPAKLAAGKKQLVAFKYYSTTAKNVYLAGTFNKWSPTAIKMKKAKDSPWFTASVTLDRQAEYKFVVDGVWSGDPFNLATVGPDENALYNPAVNGTTNVNPKIKVFSSKHFDFFTMDGKDKTKELEESYSKLTALIPSWKLATVMPKIRYYAADYTNNLQDSILNYPVPFARYSTSEIYDLWNVSSTHELVHLLVSVPNTFFNEGAAQALQLEGNKTYREQNVNLVAKALFAASDEYDVNTLMTQFITTSEEYSLAGSFIYYHLYVMKKPDQLRAFLMSLKGGEQQSQLAIKYKKHVGKELQATITAWKSWLEQITEQDDIYVKW
ncbi:glycogen-binding domain-containing protein [Paenibacillus oenotherae]|uniref:Glycogen-binding domain-containing protein n=1 Tax=Paenibacillus oenotherae TaxID=1435645 RepID=A0ABS7D553_9BACL|nr:glycogen-binding domain-containing protein [Paenibacillus oenotherae]MBW7474606.1 glycogen-binding domain-containing protein [Paenibacillus oenotherae]